MLAVEVLADIFSNRYHLRIRTGGAYGVDQIAMQNTRPKSLDVVLPWASYNKEIIPEDARIIVYDPRINRDWTESVKLYHPAPQYLTHIAFALHARNFGILSGTKLVIAMPSIKLGGGGTGQGIRIAQALKIPVIIGKQGFVETDQFIAACLKEATGTKTLGV